MHNLRLFTAVCILLSVEQYAPLSEQTDVEQSLSFCNSQF